MNRSDIGIMIKGQSAIGALMLLTSKGSDDDDILTDLRCKSYKTFGKVLPKMSDAHYIVSTKTLQADKGYSFIIPRSSDYAHTYVLKVSLQGPTDLDALFDSLSLMMGGSNFLEIDLRLNNVLARAYGLWPSKTNDSKIGINQKWVATIPIMLRETAAYTKVVNPLRLLLYSPHDIIELHNVTNKSAQFALDVDFVFLENETQESPDSWSVGPSIVPHIDLLYTQYQTSREYLSQDRGKIQGFPLSMSHPTSGFIVTLTPVDPNNPQNVPVISAWIELDSNPVMEFDLSDLTDWNWIKCGLKPPADYSTLLLPVSREAFWAETRDNVMICPCMINPCSAVLKMEVNDLLIGGWSVKITALTTNSRKVKF